jgi:hypothetical protein
LAVVTSLGSDPHPCVIQLLDSAGHVAASR